MCKQYEPRQTRIVRQSDLAPLQCLACSKRPECLRILSGNIILTSIKGQNSLTNLRKLTANNPRVDLVSKVLSKSVHFFSRNGSETNFWSKSNAYIKFGEILSICSQDIELKRNFGVNQGP